MDGDVMQGVQNVQRLTTGRPQILAKGDRIIVSNREIAATVNGSFSAGTSAAAGVSVEFSFGTGGGLVNSWLNKLAVAYDKFVVHKLRIEWQPTLPVTVSGTVAIWFDSDPEAVAPTGYTSSSGNMNATSVSIFGHTFVDVRADQLNRLPQYLTANNTTAPTPASTRTPGRIQTGFSDLVFGTAAGTIGIGFVWIEYQVEFLNPSNNS